MKNLMKMNDVLADEMALVFGGKMMLLTLSVAVTESSFLQNQRLTS